MFTNMPYMYIFVIISQSVEINPDENIFGFLVSVKAYHKEHLACLSLVLLLLILKYISTPDNFEM